MAADVSQGDLADRPHVPAGSLQSLRKASELRNAQLCHCFAAEHRASACSMAVRVRGSPGIGLRPGADGAAGGGPD